MRFRKPQLWALVGALALAAGAATFLQRPRPLALTWTVGSETVFDLDWSRVESAAMVATMGLRNQTTDAIGGDMHLRARLSVRALEATAQGWRLQLRLGEFRTHRLWFMGADLLRDQAEVDKIFGAQAVVVEVERSGRVVTEHFAAESPDLFKHLMHALITESQVVLAGGPASVGQGWTDDVPTLVGTARVRYQWQSLHPRVLTRTLEHYRSARAIPAPADWQASQQTLVSRGEITFDDEGGLRAIDEREDLTISVPTSKNALTLHASLQLIRSTTQAFESVALARAILPEEVRHPGEALVSNTTERRLLEQRIGDMTPERLHEDLLAFGNGGQLPDHNRWLWQATGLLIAHPGLCAELQPLFTRPEATAKARGLILDLLGGAGHAEAQASMRTLLASPAAHTNAGEYALLLQRISLLQHPDAQSLAFVAAVNHEARGHGDVMASSASLYTLGAALGHAVRTGDRAAAAIYNPQLRQTLTAATTPAEQETGLRALGNAGLSDNVDVIVPYAGRAEPSVRAAAAAALRKTPCPRATDTLLSLLTDADPRVATTAIDSLQEQPWDDGTWTRFAGTVLQGRTVPAADAALVNCLSANVDRAQVPAMLTLLANRNAGRPKLEARIRRMLDGL